MAASHSPRPGVRIDVPASSANLGPGFDVLAVALDLVNVYDVWEIPTELRIEVEGEGAGIISRDHDNLFYIAMSSYFSMARYEPTGLLIREMNRIPLGRGLGSSAATIVGALLAARAISGFALDDDRLLDLACSLEGHPDNVAAALAGGLVVVVPSGDERHEAHRLPWPDQIGCALFVPELLVSTESAREVLPQEFSRQDVVHNLARVALLVAALREGRADDLALATQDRLHQPYRAQLVPGFPDIIGAALQAGAKGAFLSGAGPTVLALYDRRSEHQGQEIAAAMAAAATGFGLEGGTMLLGVRSQGATASALPPGPGAEGGA